jgi:hypothetical protein
MDSQRSATRRSSCEQHRKDWRAECRMSNVECRMNDECKMTNENRVSERSRTIQAFGHSSFGIHSSFGDSSFVIGNSPQLFPHDALAAFEVFNG